ncbi:hypothetical protein L873DRAFT_446941 [Choiromyces venosus 120613-1]|uniref:Uncharacterized protein n=1 Tax=Choiromyces venosus 120613-1 TaxID=1336337 RepID=A0A3N4JZD7_9PEZI|nr:hypothetical protein L873DRAFT_446941 [Choiromyces venosus 120613-1]
MVDGRVGYEWWVIANIIFVCPHSLLNQETRQQQQASRRPGEEDCGSLLIHQTMLFIHPIIPPTLLKTPRKRKQVTTGEPHTIPHHHRSKGRGKKRRKKKYLITNQREKSEGKEKEKKKKGKKRKKKNPRLPFPFSPIHRLTF